jgi:hypothetical protein
VALDGAVPTGSDTINVKAQHCIQCCTASTFLACSDPITNTGSGKSPEPEQSPALNVECYEHKE